MNLVKYVKNLQKTKKITPKNIAVTLTGHRIFGIKVVSAFLQHHRIYCSKTNIISKSRNDLKTETISINNQ